MVVLPWRVWAQLLAKQMIDGGMSKRQAAKALGVSDRTVRDDIGGAGKRRIILQPARPRKHLALWRLGVRRDKSRDNDLARPPRGTPPFS